MRIEQNQTLLLQEGDRLMGFRYKMYKHSRQCNIIYCEVDEDTMKDIFADSNGDFDTFEEMVKEHCYCNYDDDGYDVDIEAFDDYENELCLSNNLREYFEQMKGD